MVSGQSYLIGYYASLIYSLAMFVAMIGFPSAKINIGLNVTARRADGFHEIETILYPVGWCDILEIVPAGKEAPPGFTSTGLSVDTGSASNLVVRARDLFERIYGKLHLYIHLHKQIPHGAGLGGGSGDAATTLKLLSELTQKHLPAHQLRKMAAELGSDCPFFIDNIPALATGRGELLTPIPNILSGYFLIIVKPPVSVSTAWAYSLITPRTPLVSLSRFSTMPVIQWKETLFNDFEEPVISHFPVIGEIKKHLYSSGAIYASMSGSGSAVYGIFKKEVKIERLNKDDVSWSGWLT